MVDLFKGGGCGQAHKYFPFMQSDDRCCKKTVYQKTEIHEKVSLGDFFACILEIVYKYDMKILRMLKMFKIWA